MCRFNRSLHSFVCTCRWAKNFCIYRYTKSTSTQSFILMSLSRFCIFCWCKICQRWYLRLYSTCKYKFKTHISFGWIRQYTSPIFYSLQTYSSLSSFDESNTSPVRLISLSIQIHFRKMILSDFPLFTNEMAVVWNYQACNMLIRNYSWIVTFS